MAHQIEDVELEEEEEYDENADEDFNPEAAREEGDVSSSSEDEEAKEVVKPAKGRGKKRKSEFVADELDSGDEATIQERKKKKRRKEGQDAAQEEDEESAGEGGLIKTRAQRLAEKTEKKHRRMARVGEVTVDVEQLWEDLSRIPIGRTAANTSNVGLAVGKDAMDVDAEDDKENAPLRQPEQSMAQTDDADEMITIKRRIEYAGEITEVEERVPRSSKEAQAYLASNPSVEDPANKHPKGLLRPLRRPSIFEPNPTASVKGVPPDRLRPRAPSRLDVVMAEKRAEEERQKKAEKMTTVQKSALDWRGFVAGEEGLREELDEYGKSKRGYLAREEFLGRAELRKESMARDARLKS